MIGARMRRAASGLMVPDPAGYADEVAADSPFAWWRFEETSGSTVADEVGSNDGTVYGADLNVSGTPETGSAVSFDGVDDYIDVGTLSTLPLGGSSPLTVEVLVRGVEASGQYVLAQLRTGVSDGTVLQIQVVADGDNIRYGFSFRVGQFSSSQKTVRTAAFAPDNQWHHVVFVYRGNSSTMLAYLDGTEESDVTQDNTLGSRTGLNTHGLVFGARNLNGTIDSFSEGDGDEFAIYDSQLSAARVLAHAQAAGVA